MGTAFIAIYGIFSLAVFVFSIYVAWRIFSKAGYSGARSLWMLVPIANIIIIIMFAFSEWPIQREINQLRQATGGGQPQYPQYAQPPQR